MHQELALRVKSLFLRVLFLHRSLSIYTYIMTVSYQTSKSFIYDILITFCQITHSDSKEDCRYIMCSTYNIWLMRRRISCDAYYIPIIYIIVASSRLIKTGQVDWSVNFSIFETQVTPSNVLCHRLECCSVFKKVF